MEVLASISSSKKAVNDVPDHGYIQTIAVGKTVKT